MDIFGIILGGGNGVRLGGVDKARLRLSGNTLLQHVTARLESQCNSIVAVGIEPQRIGVDLPAISDVFQPPIGPLGGIYTGALWAKSQTKDIAKSWILTAPVDGPLFPKDFFSRASAIDSGRGPIIGRFGSNLYPVCGLWPLAHALKIADLHKQQSGNAIRPVLSALNAQELDFEPFYQQNPFINANQIGDLLQLASRIRG